MASHGDIFFAHKQWAGKGQRGKTWASLPGENIIMSAVLEPVFLSVTRQFPLSACVALACHDLYSRYVPLGQTSIKWPNDLMFGNRKLGGILTELSSELDRIHFAVLGMGINVNSTAADLPPELAAGAVSMREVLGKRLPRAALAVDLWGRLERWINLHAEQGFGPVRVAWKELCGMLGQPVLIQTGKKQVCGIAEDIDESGALIVRDRAGAKERVVAGDVEQISGERVRRD